MTNSTLAYRVAIYYGGGLGSHGIKHDCIKGLLRKREDLPEGWKDAVKMFAKGWNFAGIGRACMWRAYYMLNQQGVIRAMNHKPDPTSTQQPTIRTATKLFSSQNWLRARFASKQPQSIFIHKIRKYSRNHHFISEAALAAESHILSSSYQRVVLHVLFDHFQKQTRCHLKRKLCKSFEGRFLNNFISHYRVCVHSSDTKMYMHNCF